MKEEILDLKDLLERVMDDKELVLELLDDFENDYLNNGVLLKDAIEQKDFLKIKGMAHRIKGAAGNISVKSMHNTCTLIENMAERGEQLDIISELVKDLDSQFSELQAHMVKLRKKLA